MYDQRASAAWGMEEIAPGVHRAPVTWRATILRPDPVPLERCEGCGGKFPRVTNKRFCSPLCRQRHWVPPGMRRALAYIAELDAS